MRTALNLPRSKRSPRPAKIPHLYCAEVLRTCELAAIRAKCAGDELAAHWATLAQQAADGAALPDLVQARSWCHVLEVRLKERAAELEQARHALDNAWRAAARAQGQPASLNGLFDQEFLFDDENQNWTLLAQSAGIFAASTCAPKHGE